MPVAEQTRFSFARDEAIADTPRARVNRARDRAMSRVGQAAEDRNPGFAEQAEAFIVDFLRAHGPTAGEVLTIACKAAGIRPHDDRAFGPVYFRLVHAGALVKVGTARRERGHGTAGGNVWSLRERQEG